MPFANDDCEMRGSWHRSPMISTFPDRAFKTTAYGANHFQQHFHTSVYYHDSSAPHPSAFSQYYGAPYDSKIGVLPETPGHNPFRHSQLRGLRTRNVSERQIIDPPITYSRLGSSVRREYDIDDVFCPSYVDHDAVKLRNQLNSVSSTVSATTAAPGELISSAKSAVEKFGGTSPTPEACAEQHSNSEHSIDSNASSDGDKVIHYCTSVDSEAERALLLSMGWQEAANDDDSDISQQEIEEFYRLLRSSRSSSAQQGRFFGRMRHTSDQTSSTPGLSTGSTPAQQEVFDEKCLSDDGLSSDDSLSINEDD